MIAGLSLHLIPPLLQTTTVWMELFSYDRPIVRRLTPSSSGILVILANSVFFFIFVPAHLQSVPVSG